VSHPVNSDPPPLAKTRPRLATLVHRDEDITSTSPSSAEMIVRDRGLLVRIDAVNAGQVFTINSEEFTLGRHPDNSGCVDDQGISRYHAKITRTDNTLYAVEDLNSSNGTFVNGAQVERAELNNGDTLQLGPRVSFRFSIASSAEERVMRQLYESSVKDPMTQVFNRQYFEAQLTSELSFALRHHTELSLLVVDLDYFKKVNDTYGHLAGDAVLRSAAEVLQSQLRTEDTLARYGGEEFVVLLRGVALTDAVRAAERLRSAVERASFTYGSQVIPVTLSIGCASVADCGEASPEVLIEIADRRLYAAKNNGRNRVVGR
jgi:two-component system cell cycle response regulator